MDHIKEFKRQVEVASLIYEHNGKYSDYEISDKLKIQYSTLQRDFRALRSMDVNIWSSKKRVYIDIKPKVLNFLVHTYIGFNTKNVLRSLKQIKDKYKNKTISLFVNIIKAINEKKYLKLECIDNKGEVNVVILEPIYLISFNKTYYLLGYENNDLNFYRIEKIENFQLLSQKFSRNVPELHDIYKNSWGIFSGGQEILAVLKFDKSKEKLFTHRFLAEEQEIEYEGKSIIVKMKVKLSYEFLSWVIGWGSEITILGPETLKSQALEKARGLIANH